MNNLHKIRKNGIPIWVQQLVLAWNDMTSGYKIYYNPVNDTARFTEYSEYETEQQWRFDLHWDEYMNDENLDKFTPDMVIIKV